jgi:hypothetical protein
MAFMNQERKKQLAPGIKAVLKKYGYKGSVAVYNHSTLVVNIKEGTFDFIEQACAHNKEVSDRRGTPYYPVTDYVQVNTYYPEHYGEAAEFLEELIAAMKGTGWYNNTDSQIDYFDIAYYLDINVGQWNRPYVCTAKEMETV